MYSKMSLDPDLRRNLLSLPCCPETSLHSVKNPRQILPMREAEKLRQYSSVMGLMMMCHNGSGKRGHSQIPSLLSPSTLPSLTSPALPLCLSLLLSIIPDTGRINQVRPSAPPCPPKLSPSSSFHPPSAPWDRFHFFHSVCSPPVALKSLSWIQAWICRVCVVLLGRLGWKLKLTHIFPGCTPSFRHVSWQLTHHTLGCLPPPPPPPAWCSPASWRVPAFFKETTCFRELSALSPQNPNLSWGFLTPVAAVWHLPAWSDSTNAPTFLSGSKQTPHTSWSAHSNVHRSDVFQITKTGSLQSKNRAVQHFHSRFLSTFHLRITAVRNEDGAAATISCRTPFICQNL